MDWKALAAEFPRDEVSWRVQGKPYERNGTFSAMALAYIDARDVQDRLDDVCGPENWQDEYEVLPSGLYVAKIGIRSEDGWIWKTDGAGETAVEGKKGGLSDAFKRCGVKWGIGRYLYRLDSPWVRCEVRQSKNGPAWKKWAEDPWSKVKTSSYQRAEVERENAHIAANVANLKSTETLEELRALFESLPHDIKSHVDVIAAKDDRKHDLSVKEAA